jgi:NitT/TauT family transport system permease protein
MRRSTSDGLQWAAAAVLFYVVWDQLLAPSVSRAFIVPPWRVWSRIEEWSANGVLGNLILTTLSEALVGLAIGVALGVLAALVVGLSPRLVGDVIEPAVTAFYAAPKFVLIPLLFVWMSNGFLPRTLFVVVAVFAVIFVNTVTGLRTVDPDCVRMLQLLGATRAQIATKLLLPHAMGYVVTALTFAAPFALTIAIGAEILFGTRDGLGGMLFNASQRFDAASVLAALLVATILSAVLIVLSARFGALFQPARQSPE